MSEGSVFPDYLLTHNNNNISNKHLKINENIFFIKNIFENLNLAHAYGQVIEEF